MTTAIDLEVREVLVPAALVVQLKGRAGNGPGEMAEAMSKAWAALMVLVERYKLAVAGAQRTTYYEWDSTGTRFAVALPIASAPPVDIAEPGAAVMAIPETSALRFVHRGAYATIADTYTRIDHWLREREAIKTQADWSRYMPMWEEYVNDPATTPPSELITYIYLPLH